MRQDVLSGSAEREVAVPKAGNRPTLIDTCGTILADALVERRGDVCIFAAVEENLLNFSIKDNRHQNLSLLGAVLCIVQRLVVIQPVGPRVVEEDGIRPRSKY